MRSLRSPSRLLLVVLSGCATDPVGEAPTWHQDVAPILEARCGSCHFAGGIAPFSVERYEDALPYAQQIASEVRSGQMPPWLATETEICATDHTWKDDLRLDEAEKAILFAWAEAEGPEGDPTTAAPLPVPPSLDLVAPDAVLPSRATYDAPAEGDEFRCFVLDPGATVDRWITGVQVVPGDAEVVHHVLVWTDPTASGEQAAEADGSWSCFGGTGAEEQGFMIHAWAPGGVPMVPPEGSGIPLPAGSRIVMQVHYHGAGEPRVDQTAIELSWTETEPELYSITTLLGNARNAGEGLLPGPNDDGAARFFIPAGVSGHQERMTTTLPQNWPPLPVWAVATHMHLAGTGMRIEVESGEERTNECLIETPRWDFDWQRWYSYDAPISALPTVKGGDTIVLTCDYDNSLANERVAEALADEGLSAPVDIRLGEETLDEMCIGVFGLLVEPEWVR